MKYYIVVSNNNLITWGAVEEDYWVRFSNEPGVIEIPQMYDPKSQRFENNNVYILTAQELLDAAKKEKKKEMKALCLKKMTNGFNSNGVQFESSAEDQMAIQVLVLQATLAKIDSSPFNIVVTAKDESDVVLNRAGVLQLGLDLQQMLSNVQDKFRIAKGLINAAVTVEAVNAVGWP